MCWTFSFKERKNKKKYQCNQCGLEFNKGQALSYHFRLTHQQEVCDISSTKLQKKCDHKIVDEKKEEPQFRCKECGAIFDRAYALTTHFKVEHGPKLICDICGCPCVNDNVLQSHYKRHEPKEFSCNSCNSDYDNATDFNNHLKTHNTDLLYACSKCDAAFASTTALSSHLRYVHARPRNAKQSKTSNLAKRVKRWEWLTCGFYLNNGTNFTYVITLKSLC